jgi:hypothetical protein
VRMVWVNEPFSSSLDPMMVPEQGITNLFFTPTQDQSNYYLATHTYMKACMHAYTPSIPLRARDTRLTTDWEALRADNLVGRSK